MRRLFPIFCIFALLLASCGAPTTSTPSAGFGSTPQQSTPSAEAKNCIDARLPTPSADSPSLFAPVSEADHILGPREAYVSVLVYSDFVCASCAKLASLLKSIQAKHSADVRVIFRPFPLVSKYDKSALAAQAAEAAALQDKFWEMHDFLFANQAQWQAQKPEEFQEWLVIQAGELGLDKSRFETDLTSPEITALVQKAWDDGQKIQLPGAPVILVNDEIIKWQANLLEGLESIILLNLLPKRQFSTCPPIVITPGAKYDARLKTSKGEVVIRLFEKQAPNTVNNFIFLAQQGWYENVPFFRVVPGFIARTGDPTGTGMGGPGYFIPNETDSGLRFDRAGLVGMVNSGRDTNGSQFFITLGPAPQLKTDYTLFGQVISGMEVLTQLTPRDPTKATGQPLPEPDMLISVTIEAK